MARYENIFFGPKKNKRYIQNPQTFQKKQNPNHLPSATMPVAEKKQKNTHLPSATMHLPPPPAIHTPQCKRYFGGFFLGENRVLAEIAE
jgi:hypothetical protein